MTSTLAVIGAICWRTWAKTMRRPATLAFSFLQPVFWILFFGFLFQRYDIGALRNGTSYLDFLVAGVCAMTVLFGASQSGVPLLRDIHTGFLGRMLRTPANPMAVVGGKLIADVARLLAQAGAIAILGVFLGARLTPSPVGAAIALVALALFAIAICSFSSLVAIKTGAHESMAAFVHVVNMPLLFTSSALVPARHMPDWLAEISRYNPLTMAVDVTRSGLLDVEFVSLGRSLLLLGALAIVLLLSLAWVARRFGAPKP